MAHRDSEKPQGTRSGARPLAFALWLLMPLGMASVAWFDARLVAAGRADLSDLSFSVALPTLGSLSAATIGAIVAARRPRHPVGWLLLALALSLVAAGVASQYADYALVARPGALPAAGEAARLGPAFSVAAIAFVGFVLLLTPDGSLPGKRWRPWAWLVGAASIVAITLIIVGRGPTATQYVASENPLDLRYLDGVTLVAAQLAFGMTGIAILIAVGSLVVRFRLAEGVERLRLRWVALGAAIVGVTIVATFFAQRFDAPPLVGWSAGAGLVILPFTLGAAILRYRLYDLDAIVSRAVAYGLLTLLLGAGYGAVSLVAGPILGRGSDVTVALGTLVAAAAFHPARRRIQAAVDARFNRRRFDAGLTARAFAARLRDEVDLETMSRDLLIVVRERLEPAHLSLWLRPQAGSDAAHGDIRA